MEFETTISKDIRIAKDKAAYDASCRRRDAVERQATERGMAKGMAQGISKGIEQARISAIESLMTTMGMTVQEAMSALQIDRDEQLKYLMMIKK